MFFEHSFDLDDAERVSTITTISGNNQLTAPTPGWDSNVIKAVKWHRSGDDYLRPLGLIDLEQSEEAKLKTYSSNDPIYWYVNNGGLYIVPTPTDTYTIKVFYQVIQPDITSSNITDTPILTTKGYNTLTDGIYAYLRESAGDPEWQALRDEFIISVKRYYQRNKHTYKRQGFKTIRVKPKLGDRKL